MGLWLRVTRSLNDRSESWGLILTVKTDTLSVVVGHPQGCPLCPILFVIFVSMVSKCSWHEESVRFGNLGIAALLFADDVVLLASSGCKLQLALGCFAAEYEVASGENQHL